MNFDLTEDQKMLRDTAASFAKKDSPVERFRKLRDDDVGYDVKVWRQMGELGWLGIPFPEDVGGFGGTMVDAALVLEQLSRTLVPEPYLASVILGGVAVLRAGSAEQHGRWLEPLVEGKTSLALAIAESASRFNNTSVATRAEKAGDDYRLSGEKVFALNGHVADTLVVSARTSGDTHDRDGVSLFAVDRTADGIETTPVTTMDGRRAAHFKFSGVSVGSDRLLGAEGGAAPVLDEITDAGCAAVCAEGVGVVQSSLELTTDYLKTREQFGARIGVFQALQHRAVDMFIQSELVRSTAIEAAIRTSDGSDADTRGGAVSAAKVQLATGGKFVTQQAMQLFGGIAITDEHDIGLFFKRMHVLNTLLGDEEHHLARFASLPSFAAQAG